jgi:hypothetical protein
MLWNHHIDFAVGGWRRRNGGSDHAVSPVTLLLQGLDLMLLGGSLEATTPLLLDPYRETV